MQPGFALSLFVGASLVAACGPAARGGADDDGDGDGDADAAVTDGGSIDSTLFADGAPLPDADGDPPAPENCGVLPVTYRDLLPDHPDFEEAEARMGDDRGIVATMIGTDRKPRYGHAGATRTVTSPTSFGQWYNTDTTGTVNVEVPGELRLTETTPGLFVFESDAFFPVNGRGFETTVGANNFHFTTEIHGSFTYRGEEIFTFRGDDDVFVFVNGVLAIDLGGVHTPQASTIDFDARAAEFGLTRGNTYPLDVFHAERHRVQSNFRIETTIECLVPPVD